MESTQRYDVIVLGGGPAGVEAAAEAASKGMNTALVADMPLGGRATYGSLLPSKAWLHAAEHRDPGDTPNLSPLRSRIQQFQKERTTQLAARLEEVGVSVFSGTGRLIDRSHIDLETDGDRRRLEAGSIIIAVGSEPRFFPDVKPDGDRMIAPRHTQKLQEIPKTMVMVGGGVTGTEYASAFQKMGTSVHLITDIDRLLPRTDPELAEQIRSYLERIGVQFTFSSPIQSVESDGSQVTTTTADGSAFTTDYAFIATGRRPDHSYGEEATEKPEQADGGWLAVDENGRTSLQGVYAIGDIAGAPLTANNAHYMARRVVVTIDGRAPAERHPSLLEAVYTNPQVAHVGPVLELAEGSRDGICLVRRSYGETLLGRIHGQEEGLLKLWVDENDESIRGAAAFGESAVEVLAPVQLAMEHGISYSELRATPFAHPALSEILSL
jgi:dihydrolipoamide dehydrogenase